MARNPPGRMHPLPSPGPFHRTFSRLRSVAPRFSVILRAPLPQARSLSLSAQRSPGQRPGALGEGGASSGRGLARGGEPAGDRGGGSGGQEGGAEGRDGRARRRRERWLCGGRPRRGVVASRGGSRQLSGLLRCRRRLRGRFGAVRYDRGRVGQRVGRQGSTERLSDALRGRVGRFRSRRPRRGLRDLSMRARAGLSGGGGLTRTRRPACLAWLLPLGIEARRAGAALACFA